MLVILFDICFFSFLRRQDKLHVFERHNAQFGIPRSNSIYCFTEEIAMTAIVAAAATALIKTMNYAKMAYIQIYNTVAVHIYSARNANKRKIKGYQSIT